MDRVTVRLLGTIDVSIDGVPRPVRGLRRLAALAALALEPGQIVDAGRLIDLVWGERPPPAAATTLQSHVSHLRRLLGAPGAIVARPPGYVLDVGDEATDVRIAQRLIRQAGEAEDPAERERLLTAAVALWRGRSLAQLGSLGRFDGHVARLEQMSLRAWQFLAETRLALGRPEELIPVLEQLSRTHPLHEQFHRLLMLALYRTGRQGDALAVFRRLRQTLDEELGVSPSRPLHDLETAVLRQDPALDAEPATATSVVRPAQLPPPTAAFTGRRDELARLDGLLARAGGSDDRAVVAVVTGPAGIGKTALAVHWAHRAAASFPSGQLYVNLRGFDGSGPALEPAAALREFLDAFGVVPQRIPSGLDARAALFRSLAADRPVLVVLDNAVDAQQVRPLLPGAPGCLTVVTSRNRLTSLVATDGAEVVPVDLLTAREAVELLSRRPGGDRWMAEPAAADEIIARCAGLPLALAVVAARSATHPEFTLADIAAELRAAAGPLDALHGGDDVADVRTVLSWSCRGLEPDAARLLRLLAGQPGPDFTPAAAASVAGWPIRRVRAALAELTGGHLLTLDRPGRYGLHDLLRAFAAEQATLTDPPDERRAATDRVLDHYVHTAHAAARALDPYRHPISLAAPRPGAIVEAPTDHGDALVWFDAELTVLLAALEQAAAAGSDDHVWALAWSLADVLERRGLWDEFAATQRAALAAAGRLADRREQVRAHNALARAYLRLRRPADAWAHLRQAGEVSKVAGDAIGQANAELNLAEVRARQGHHRDALDHARRALDLFGTVSHTPGLGLAFNAVGWFHAQLGEYRPALEACRRALAVMRNLDDRAGLAATWDSLGYVHHHLNHHVRAVTCYHRAVTLYHELGDTYEEATSLTNLGDAYATRDLQRAREAWRRAAQMLDELGHADAVRVRARMRSGGGASLGGEPPAHAAARAPNV